MNFLQITRTINSVEFKGLYMLFNLGKKFKIKMDNSQIC